MVEGRPKGKIRALEPPPTIKTAQKNFKNPFKFLMKE